MIAVMGPTASGKTELAENLARELKAQLINADAFQVYRGLDIGTAKTVRKSDYLLLDLKEPNEEFGLGEWVKHACQILNELWERRQSAVVVGGTGLYIRALFEAYSDMQARPSQAIRDAIALQSHEERVAKLLSIRSDAAELLDLTNPRRVSRALEKALSPEEHVKVELPPFIQHKFAISPDIEVLDARIADRIARMLSMGWVNEVKALQEQGITQEAPGMRAIGYLEVSNLIHEKVTMEEAISQIELRTRQYAKRQRTWLRSEPKLTFLEDGKDGLPLAQILSKLQE